MTTLATWQMEKRIPRARMVERLREHYHIRDARVLEAMSNVPRHIFVPETFKSHAYEDSALAIAANQTISQPFIVARMTELVAVDKTSRVLEIGAGSGYQTAILAQLARHVFAIERVPELTREAQARMRDLGILNASINCFDGTLGWSANAPYDAILVAAGSPVLPEPLVNQLSVGGRLVIPVGENLKSQRLLRIIRQQKGFAQEDHGACSFVPLIGQHGWKP